MISSVPYVKDLQESGHVWLAFSAVQKYPDVNGWRAVDSTVRQTKVAKSKSRRGRSQSFTIKPKNAWKKPLS